MRLVRIKMEYLLICSLFFSCKSITSSDNKEIELMTIGTKDFIWIDLEREDDFYSGHRILNVRVWYPSNHDHEGHDKATYLLFQNKINGPIDGSSEADFNRIKEIETSSYQESSLQVNINKSPLLVFSPSLGGNLSYYTFYAEYFAKKGYIVMGVNHLHESEVVIDNNFAIFPANHHFQDSLKSLEIPDDITADDYRKALGKRQKVLGEDIVFAINKILSEEDFNKVIDIEKITVFGHSLGGAAAIYASVLDNRIKGVINFDGTPPSIALENGIEVPFLFIEDLTDYKNHQGYAKMHKRRNQFCDKNKGDSWRILIEGFTHNSFLDINYFLAESKEQMESEEINLSLISDVMEEFIQYAVNGRNRPKFDKILSDRVTILSFEKN